MTGLSGKIGKHMVVKQYTYGTVISKYPDMSAVPTSDSQRSKRDIFKMAVAYARSVLQNPDMKNAYMAELPTGASVYHAALKDFLKNQ